MSELTFEVLALALEPTRGSAVATPTHYANMKGMIKPAFERYYPEESRGTLAEFHRSKLVKRWGEWEGEGPLDVDVMPVFFNMMVKGNVTTPTTPGGATLSRLWSFVPTMTSDDIESATTWWGDPNVQLWKGIYSMIDEMTISNDASSSDGATFSANGQCRHPLYRRAITAVTQANPGVVTSAGHRLVNGDQVTISGVGGMTQLNGNTYTVASATTDTFALSATDTAAFGAYTTGGVWKLAAPTFPAQTAGPLITGLQMQLWIDVAAAIGTTEITGRVVSAEHVIPNNLAYKFLAAGPASDLSYTRVGRGKRSIKTTVVVELLDTAQYDLFEDDSIVKMRVRHNGPAIETGFYNYVEVDTYGHMDVTDWGEFESINRTVTLEVTSEYDATLTADFRVAVQNDNATL